MYTIGDFLIRVQNAYMAGMKKLEYPHSNVVLSISKILEKEGYLKAIKSEKSKIKNGRDSIMIELLYKDKLPAISEVKLVSKPSVHRYFSKIKLKRAVARHGIGILSTSRGIMTTKQAQKEGVGGELICKIF
jgi:small subunit ribosomal protein S8